MDLGSSASKFGYWGEPTATIDWCEKNYELTHYIAEFWNTVSNVFLCIFAVFGVKMCLREKHGTDLLILYFLIGVVGIGSALFHGTLLKVAQQLDETPMMIAIVNWNYSLWKKKLPWTDTYFWVFAIIVHDVLVTVFHAYFQSVTPFQLYFAAWTLVGAYRLMQLYHNEFKDDIVVKGLIKGYITTMLVATTIWLGDQHFCSFLHELPFNPQGHAWWHVLSGFACYMGPSALAFYLAEAENRNPRITYYGPLPYVHTKVKA